MIIDRLIFISQFSFDLPTFALSVHMKSTFTFNSSVSSDRQQLHFIISEIVLISSFNNIDNRLFKVFYNRSSHIFVHFLSCLCTCLTFSSSCFLPSSKFLVFTMKRTKFIGIWRPFVLIIDCPTFSDVCSHFAHFLSSLPLSATCLTSASWFLLLHPSIPNSSAAPVFSLSNHVSAPILNIFVFYKWRFLFCEERRKRSRVTPQRYRFSCWYLYTCSHFSQSHPRIVVILSSKLSLQSYSINYKRLKFLCVVL